MFFLASLNIIVVWGKTRSVGLELWDVLKLESLWRVVTGYLTLAQISRQAYKLGRDY